MKTLYVNDPTSNEPHESYRINQPSKRQNKLVYDIPRSIDPRRSFNPTGISSPTSYELPQTFHDPNLFYIKEN